MLRPFETFNVMTSRNFFAYHPASDSYDFQALYCSQSDSKTPVPIPNHPEHYRDAGYIETCSRSTAHIRVSNSAYIEPDKGCPQSADPTNQQQIEQIAHAENSRLPILVLSQQHLSFIHPHSSESSSFVLPCPLQSSIHNWTYVFISELQGALVTGGIPGSEEGVCLWLEQASGQLVVLSSLSHYRHCHGMAFCKGSAYVFGGKSRLNQTLNCAEAFHVVQSLENSHWTVLPNLMTQPRSHLSPCLHHCQVYLASGGHPSIEVFSPLHLSFRPLNLSLYDQSDCIMAADKDFLVIVTTTFVYKVKVGTWEIEAGRHKPCNVWANAPALLCDGCMYAAKDGHLISIEVATGVVREGYFST